MKKWNSTRDFAVEIVQIDTAYVTKNDPNKERITFKQAQYIADEIVWCHTKGNAYHPTMAVHSKIRDGRGGTRFLFSESQKERMIQIYDELFKYYWFPFSRIRRNMRRLCRK